MATRYISFVPLAKVPSAFLNRLQQGVFTQRGTGISNSLATGLDTPSTLVSAGHLFVAMDAPAYDPMFFFIAIDTSQDFRDRWLTLDLQFDPTNDIRPGKAKDGAVPFESVRQSIYTGIGGALQMLSPNLGVYVDASNGQIGMKKSAGYMRGRIDFTAQLKERS